MTTIAEYPEEPEALRTPEERVREVARILASGILRMRRGLLPPPEAPIAVPECDLEEPSESNRYCLDVSTAPRPHVPAARGRIGNISLCFSYASYIIWLCKRIAETSGRNR
jgi:hypothetical protein